MGDRQAMGTGRSGEKGARNLQVTGSPSLQLREMLGEQR